MRQHLTAGAYLSKLNDPVRPRFVALVARGRLIKNASLATTWKIVALEHF